MRGEDEADAIALGAIDARLQHRQRVATDGVHLRVQLDGEDAIACVEHRRRGIAGDHGLSIACPGKDQQLRRLGAERAGLADRVATGAKCLGQQRWRLGLHRGKELLDPDGVDDLERTEIPAETPPHRAIDIVDVMRDGLPDTRRVEERVSKRGARERRLLGGAEHQRLDAAADAAPLVAKRIEHRTSHRHAWHVLERRRVEHEDVGGPAGAPGALEEALAGLLADPATLEQPGDAGADREQALQIGVAGSFDEVARDLGRHVETGDVDRPERRALGTADGRSRHRVDRVDVERALLPGLQHPEQPVQADVVGDEVRRVLGDDNAAAQPDVEPVPGASNGVLARRGHGDDLDERHVAGRIEEVRADEVAGESLGASLDEAGERQPRGVGADDGVGPSLAIDPLEEAALRLESLDDGFDNPVRLAERRIVDGAGAHERRMCRREERIRLECERSLPSGRGCGGIDVQQVDLDAGIGHVCGNLGAHGAGADHDGSAKGGGHGRVIISPKRRTPNAERSHGAALSITGRSRRPSGRRSGHGRGDRASEVEHWTSRTHGPWPDGA